MGWQDSLVRSAVYTAGQAINYDGWIDNDGYIWITYIAGSGNRRYVVVGTDGVIHSFGSFGLKGGEPCVLILPI